MHRVIVGVILLSVGTYVYGQDSFPPLPERMWVLMVGPTWSQAFNEDVSISGTSWSFNSESFYRRYQPYVGLEMFVHANTRWVYSIGLSYHERYTDNLLEGKYLIRSANIEFHGGVPISGRRVIKPIPYYFMPNVDTTTYRVYVTLGVYSGRILSLKRYYGRGELVPYSPWDVGVKLRLFGQYYKYRAKQRFLSVQVQVGMGVSLKKIAGYYLLTNYMQELGFGASSFVYFIHPIFRFSYVM